VFPVSLPPLTTSDPALATAPQLTGADVAQALGFSGEGVRVAVIDSGIDYHHPDLGGCFGSGCKVAFGHDFVGDAFNFDRTSPAYNPVPRPDRDPDDCPDPTGGGGHGTHVAGIVGANGTVKGVAPGVTLGAYRVFGCSGSSSSDVILAAMDRVLADRVQVLNMSLGADFQWPQYPTAVAADRLVRRGVTVVAAFGNAGASGLYAGGAPAVGERVIAVAAFDNTRLVMPVLAVSPGNADVPFDLATGAPLPPKMGSLPLARTGTPAATADACDPLPPGSLTGRAVLIRRGTCAFHLKALNAQNAGASAVVLYNNVAGRLNASVAGSPPITIPVVTVSAADGVAIDARIAAGGATLTWTDRTVSLVVPSGGLISPFSSYGLPPDLSFKPDLGAPGGYIRSTYVLEKGGYASLNGTSMSAPHVAGAVALLLQEGDRRTLRRPEDVRDLLLNTAVPRPHPTEDLLDNVHRQGAGMLRVDDALRALGAIKDEGSGVRAMISPSRLALGESQAGSARRTLTVENLGQTEITFDVKHVPALATGPNTFTPSFLDGATAEVAISPAVLTLGPRRRADVQVIISPNPGLPNRSLYGGYVVFTPRADGQTYRVPFSGLKGDYQSFNTLAPTACALPWLAKALPAGSPPSPCAGGGTLSGFANQPQGATYTLQNGDAPYILAHLDHPARSMELEILDAGSGQPLTRFPSTVFRDYFVPRNSTAGAFFAISWDGSSVRLAGPEGLEQVVLTYEVPDGRYRLRLRVVKALGDGRNAADVETWTSPEITLDRPQTEEPGPLPIPRR
jgi:subtilisin family serine protease